MELEAANAFLSTYMSRSFKHWLLLKAKSRILFPQRQVSSRSSQGAVKSGALLAGVRRLPCAAEAVGTTTNVVRRDIR